MSWNAQSRTTLFLIAITCALSQSLEFMDNRAAAQSRTFAVRRSVPFRAGDRWRADIVATKETRGTVIVPGEEKKANEKETTNLSMVVTIDRVDDQGYAATWTVRIIKFDRSQSGRKRTVLLKPGSEVRCDDLAGELTMELDGRPLAEPGNELRHYVRLPTRSDDAPFEPRDKIQLGGSWAADVAAMRKSILESGPPQLREHPDVFRLVASGRLGANVQKSQGVETLDIRLRTTTEITEPLEQPNQFLEKMKSTVEESYAMPIDYSTDFLSKKTVQTEVLETIGKGLAPSLDVTITTTTIERRSYVNFAGEGVRPSRGMEGAESLLNGLLVGLTGDKDSVSGSGDAARIQSIGEIKSPLPIRSGGFRGGKVGAGLHFDGRGSFIKVVGGKGRIREGLDGFSVACWTKTWTDKVEFLLDVGFYADSSVSIVMNKGRATFHVPKSAGGVGLDFPFGKEQWTHLAVTWDGEYQRAYINGEMVAEAKTSRRGRLNAETVGDLSLLIGSQSKSASRGGRYYGGEIDEFGIWSRALEPAEISYMVEQGNAGKSIFR